MPKEGKKADAEDNDPHPIYMPKVFYDDRMRPPSMPENIDRPGLTGSKDLHSAYSCYFWTIIVVLIWAWCLYQNPKAVLRLNHGFDFQGRLCGDPNVKEVAAKPYVFFCGSKERMPGDSNYPKHLYFRSRTCVDACPTSANATVECLRPETTQFTEGGVTQEGFLTYEKTYSVFVQQTVEMGHAYPSTPFGSHCMPKNEELKLSVYYGPLAEKDRLGKMASAGAAGGIVLLLSAFMASLLGYFYLKLVDRCAGMVIFMTLIAGTVLSALLGVFFCLALFFNPEDYNNGYNELNPIMHTFEGWDGKFYSIVVGVLLLLYAVCLGYSTHNQIPEIDKHIGIIAAGLDAVNQNEMWLGAMMWSTVIMIQCAIFLAGLAIITTYGYVDGNNITVNGEDYGGLEASFQWYWGWHAVVVGYVVYCWWIFEQSIVSYQYGVTYSMAQWFWVPPIDDPKPAETITISMAKSGKALVDANVTGVDAAPAGRKVLKFKGPNGVEGVFAPIGKKGPGNKDFADYTPASVTMQQATGKVKLLQSSPMLDAFGMTSPLFGCHYGTVCRAAPIFAVVRIVKLIPLFLRGLLGRQSVAHRKGYEDEDKTFSGAIRQLGLLIAGMVEHTFGGYGRNALCQVALSANDFATATTRSRILVEDSGGIVAFLHGSTLLYQVVAVIGITSICGMITNICLKNIKIFTDPANQWFFVEDSYDFTLLSMFVSGVISYTFSALYSISVDTLLYTFIWARRMKVPGLKAMLLPALDGLLGAEIEDDAGTLGMLQKAGVRHTDIFAGGHFGHAASDLATRTFGTHRIPGLEFGSKAAEQSPLLSTHPDYAN
eukprot:TRINITY_DN10908_c0_g1_i3.p1 TRINITY_DN10908_c0_g1~~TRINITY_DN10908_c0_g1_i3.p1  ORF type:complete len:826 (+),score=127.65 TRINITY_DN10908_c0_g1_i3:105-2582(+)